MIRWLRLWWDRWIRGQVTVTPPFDVACPVCAVNIHLVMICRPCQRVHVAPCGDTLTFDAMARLVERNPHE